DRLLPTAGYWTRRALAGFSLAIAVAQDCRQARLVVSIPGRATAPSRERRLRRWLAHDGLDATALRQAVARAVLQQATVGQAPLVLALDETSQGKRRRDDGTVETALKVLALRLLYRRRALPLAWACHAQGQQEKPY